jgi:hypothetical protein
MTKKCDKYTEQEISCFVDNELVPDRYKSLEQHIEHCPDCKKLVDQYKSMSAVFINHTDKMISKIDTEKLKQKILYKNSNKNSTKDSLGNIFGIFSKNIYLKLASITAILMISLYTFQGELFYPSGPSAIVKSIDTDFASVIIFETQKEKHTIIWFSET